MAGLPEYDAETGRMTTGHEWDGIKELNTPLPVWWVWVFYACIAWAVGYVVLFPAIPLGDSHTPGVLGWHSRTAGERQTATLDRMFHTEKAARLTALDISAVLADPDLRAYAERAGAVLFKENCAPCHQAGGAGTVGFPSLADDEWLWGGTPEAILTTLTHGIRDSENDPETRFNAMPAFTYLTPDDRAAVADYILASGAGTLPEGRGKAVFMENCALCHASAGEGPVPDGNEALGGPPLNNAIWLYRGDREAILSQLEAPKNSIMPAWGARLRNSDLKALAVYVHGLGGGR